jgi:hypothetical protein
MAKVGKHFLNILFWLLAFRLVYVSYLISSGEFLEACFDKIDKIPKVGYLAACCGVIHFIYYVWTWFLKMVGGLLKSNYS